MSKGHKKDTDPSQQLTEEEIEKKVDNAFSACDVNGNGRISTGELKDAFHSVGYDPTRAEVRAMIQAFDLDRSGTLDRNEFKKMMEGRWTRYSDPEEYLRAFKVFDKNGDGVLSAKELRKALTSVGEVMLQEEVDQMFAVADVDKDGKINYKEFARMMSRKDIC
ncbi:uncharacterized protein LOC135484940 [Lineus longissimus]|uniref:uncharacterized protein LOC135484940 n=1 Tax=Lineus longissimus TaxID=88925 RepID=UPI002B4F816B